MNALAAADLGAVLQLVPVQRAGFALLLAAIGLPVIGVVIVGLDIMPVRFAMMHVALLGIAVGLLTRAQGVRIRVPGGQGSAVPEDQSTGRGVGVGPGRESAGGGRGCRPVRLARASLGPASR